jgi:hypothetical protein
LNGYHAGQANDGSSEWAMFIEGQSMTQVVSYPTRSGTRDNAHQGPDLVEGSGKAMVSLAQHILDPGRSPADEVGSEQGKLHLKPLVPEGGFCRTGLHQRFLSLLCLEFFLPPRLCLSPTLR